MAISYLITVCNELKEVSSLISFLQETKRVDDEIVVIFDEENGTSEVLEYLFTQDVELHKFKFKLDFSEFKNHGGAVCKSDWIFQIDADEIPSKFLMDNIHVLIEVSDNSEGISMISIPRVNEVIGITNNHLTKWGWFDTSSEGYTTTRLISEIDSEYRNFLNERSLIISEDSTKITYKIPRINYPDYQTRVYKNNTDIKWVGRVHETVKHTSKNYNLGKIPLDRGLDLYHTKYIDRQEKQNNFYNKLV